MSHTGPYPDPDVSKEHGTDNRYSNLGCRCDVCRAAHAETQRRRRASRRQRGFEDPSLIPHGTSGGYRNWDCRCELCSEANTEAARKWRRTRARA